MENLRQKQLTQWLMDFFLLEKCVLTSMNGDAGFRRYFRFQKDEQSFIAVDSPVDKCNNSAFLSVQKQLTQVGVKVPEVLACDEQQGFMCLSDLGNCELSTVLTLDNMAIHYQQAILLLPKIASIPQQNLPVYDKAFVQLELDIFSKWLLHKHLDIQLTHEQEIQLQTCFDFLISNALEQPQVVMHRDFHSRNLMLVDNELAVIDFQDAVIGPITYDVVSLLRDCYVKWPREQIMPLLDYFVGRMSSQFSLQHINAQQWQQWFDLMGLQRHIKASGIFARLYHRDDKPSYLSDIPLTLSYIVDISAQYPECYFLESLVTNTVMPKLSQKMAEAAV
ncbi:aminoglycoside phosphotransferase family protein [Thalassotalea castellviae]|uniref:Phosphotransferase n=1 Tax=Thalassotalea castellviae TaxID=3075612 RepID=A0ABU2ZZM4_9GAMM|nr:phosphotransferase [Thalassotalea sp. W431]MDT0603149.1 phosphotransferase [Thalassotalea sp. W431]